jgi:hypothetical protein
MNDQLLRYGSVLLLHSRFLNSHLVSAITLQTAAHTIELLEFEATRCGYGIALAGSLAKGIISFNDLDLVFFHLETQRKTKHQKFVSTLKSMGFDFKGAVNYKGSTKLIYITRFQGRKVDLFFPCLTKFLRHRAQGVRLLPRLDPSAHLRLKHRRTRKSATSES